MKKVIVLSALLGMISLTSAGVDLAWTGYFDVTVSGNTVAVTGQDVVGYLFNLKPDQGILSNVMVSPAFTAFADPGVWYGSYGAQLGISAANLDPVSGVLLTFDFDPAATRIELIDSWVGRSEITFSTGTVYLVPEPITLALLGLGGVLLGLRRK